MSNSFGTDHTPQLDIEEIEQAEAMRAPVDPLGHAAVARLRRPQGSRQLAALHEEMGFETETVGASALAVVRSELRSEGSRHTVISRHGFQRP